MKLIRFRYDGEQPRFGAVIDDAVYDLTETGPFRSLKELLTAAAPLASSVDQLRRAVDDMAPSFELMGLLDAGHQAVSGKTARLLTPIDAQEVWASGVTYKRSEEARKAESQGAAQFYAKVYDADRPELFLKAPPYRTVGSHAEVGIRRDSTWNVPEPELAVVLNPRMEILGYTVGNDMSSRDIEGENPLYLPQAKVYEKACAVGPWIALDIEDPHALKIRLVIRRGGEEVFSGETSSGQMKRRIEELVSYLGRANPFPEGAVLLTGTGIVPDDSFTLLEGDTVEIEIEGIGTLKNTVVWVGAAAS